MTLRFYAATDTDPGEWFVWREEAGAKLEVKVRRLPPVEDRRIDLKHFGRKRQITYSKKGAVQDLDLQASDKANREKAAYCMVETRGFELEVAGPEAAERLTGLLGKPVAVGQAVQLDGRWTDDLKDLVFGGLPELVDWIGGRARALSGRDEEEEQEASGN
jgi:hypothetical protein